jgi:hypothetical protein
MARFCRYDNLPDKPKLNFNERRCLTQLYKMIHLWDHVDSKTLVNERHFIPFKQIAVSQLEFPYLEDFDECQQELWRLFNFYSQTYKTETKSSILQLLFRDRWTEDEFKRANVLIEQAVLSDVYTPAMYFKVEESQDPDSVPF